VLEYRDRWQAPLLLLAGSLDETETPAHAGVSLFGGRDFAVPKVRVLIGYEYQYPWYWRWWRRFKHFFRSRSRQ